MTLTARMFPRVGTSKSLKPMLHHWIRAHQKPANDTSHAYNSTSNLRFDPFLAPPPERVSEVCAETHRPGNLRLPFVEGSEIVGA